MKRVLLDSNYRSGQQRPETMVTEYDPANNDGLKLSLVRYKSMDELIKENPSYFFDKYGNFCNGSNVHVKNVSNHIAPSYFAQMGFTLHKRYDPADTSDGVPVSTWFYDVIDY